MNTARHSPMARSAGEALLGRFAGTYHRVCSSAVEPLAHNEMVAGSSPAGPTNPGAAGYPRDCSSLELPGASAPCAFPPFGQRTRDAALSAEAWKADTLNALKGAVSWVRAKRQYPAIWASTHSRSSDRPAFNPSQAKEPVAIQPYRARRLRAGGSSRPPAWRFAGPSCSGVTAEEANGRSGWKPRTFPHSADVSPGAYRRAGSNRRAKSTHLPSAAPQWCSEGRSADCHGHLWNPSNAGRALTLRRAG